MSAAAETTRIFVRNLPKHLTDDRFRQHFAAKGKVTDAKVLRTADGSSRRIGFIGFRTAEEADAAAAYFNNTFIDTSRVTVERALAFCPECGTQLWGTGTGDGPQRYSLRVGTILQRNELTPKAQIWCRSERPWVG